MEIKKIAGKFWRIFGFLYCIGNLIFSIAIIVLVLSSLDGSSLDPELLLMSFPFFGVAAGYWIWKKKYNWWKICIISFSLLVTGAVLFTALIIAPKLDDLKQKKHEKMQSDKLSEEILSEEAQQVKDSL